MGAVSLHDDGDDPNFQPSNQISFAQLPTAMTGIFKTDVESVKETNKKYANSLYLNQLVSFLSLMFTVGSLFPKQLSEFLKEEDRRNHVVTSNMIGPREKPWTFKGGEL